MASTQPVWSVPPLPRSYEHLDGHRSCDVCVIGAGIAGLTTAYQLVQRGDSVIVLEANKHICAGETGHTTAHLVNVLDDRFKHLSSVRGEDPVQAAIAKSPLRDRPHRGDRSGARHRLRLPAGSTVTCSLAKDDTRNALKDEEARRLPRAGLQASGSDQGARCSMPSTGPCLRSRTRASSIR